MIEQILQSIFEPTTSAAALSQRAAILRNLADEEFLGLVREIVSRFSVASENLPASAAQWKGLEQWLPLLQSRPGADSGLTVDLIGEIQSLYRLAPSDSNIRNSLLAWLARLGGEEGLRGWAELATDCPPEFRAGLPYAFAPLVQHPGLPAWFFKKMLGPAIAYPQIFAPALELMNLHFRQGKSEKHPAVGRETILTAILGKLSERMAQIEEGQSEYASDVNRLQLVVADSVALILALCDTLALLGYREAEGKLNQASQLRHRRVQTEAAAALARLGFEAGKSHLIELAAEPVARMRVLAYAEELGFLNVIPDEQRSEIALAESRLVHWLAEPQQFGWTPTKIELLDCREMYWPSYEHPLLCYLFRFQYGSGENRYQNVGIVGPLIHCFQHDISWMSLDDIYAAFAGWQAVHDDIYEISLDEASRHRPRWIASLTDRLNESGFQQIEPQFVGVFLQDYLLVASAQQSDHSGFVIAGDDSQHWFATDQHPEVDAEWAYTVYRGRRMLQTFNDISEHTAG